MVSDAVEAVQRSSTLLSIASWVNDTDDGAASDTVMPVALVLSLLAIKFDAWLAWITLAALALYITFTISVTDDGASPSSAAYAAGSADAAARPRSPLKAARVPAAPPSCAARFCSRCVRPAWTANWACN